MAVLDGIRVVVTGSAAALDMASLLLSDNGAEVIRVEPAGGDARRSLPAWRLWNRGTRSIVLDPSLATESAAMDRLLDTADVLLEAQGGASGLGWSMVRRVAFAGCNDISVSLGGRIGESGDLTGLKVEGFFDDRSAERLGLPGARSRLLGRLPELAAFVKRRWIDVVFVALPITTSGASCSSSTSCGTRRPPSTTFRTFPFDVIQGA